MEKLKKTQKKWLHYSLCGLLLVSLIDLYGWVPESYGANVNETVLPDVVLTQTNLTGNVAAIQDDVDSPDGNWHTAGDGSANTSLEASFSSPSNTLASGVGLQTIRVRIRKNNTGGNDPSVTLTVYDNPSSRTQIASNSITVTDATTEIAVSFNASSLSNLTGNNLEVKIDGSASGGSPASRRTVEVGAVNWDATIEGPPVTPTNFVLSSRTETSMDLSWNSVAGATSYELKRDSVVIYTGAATTYSDTGLTANTTYSYDLVARNVIGDSGVVNLTDRTLKNTVPDSVTGFGATFVNDTYVVLQWDENIDATSYEVLRDSVSIYTGTDLSYTDTGLTKSTSYTYEIRAINGYGNSTNVSLPVTTAVTLQGEWSKAGVGGSHSAGISKTGELYTWGRNFSGELGVGDNTNRGNPTKVGNDTNWETLYLGENFTFVKKTDQTFWAFGDNFFGQLGIGNTTDQNTPVSFGSGSTWVDLSIGRYTGFGIKDTGELYGWGRNDYYQIGLGSTGNQTSPVKIGSATNWSKIFAGAYHTGGIKTDGTLWMWGYNSNGQVGTGNTTNQTTPIQIGSDSWTDLAVGENFTIGIKSNGTLWSFGSNANYQLGHGDTVQRTSPTQVGTASDWVDVEYGVYSTFAKKSDGSLWVVGHNANGKLALGHANDQQTLIQFGTENNWDKAFGGFGFHSYFLTNEGRLFMAGKNDETQLGVMSGKAQHELKQEVFIHPPPHHLWVGNVASSSLELFWNDTAYETSFSLTRDGSEIYNNTAATTIDTTIAQHNTYKYGVSSLYSGKKSAESILYVDFNKNWKAIAAGMDASVAIKNDGTMWSMGMNNKGELGHGDVRDRLLMTRVGSDSNWDKVSMNSEHTAAIKTDGTLWTWGQNDVGQLGLGDTVDRTVPTQVGTDTNWVDVSVGGFFTIAKKSDGTLWSFGRNEDGQLGHGDTVNRSTPTKIGTGTDWTSFDVGTYHTLAIKTDGTLWAWGFNNTGELGIGSMTSKSIPTKVGTAANWSKVGAGYAVSGGIKTDGTLWMWGQNTYGALGFGDTTTYYAPEQLGTGTNWLEIEPQRQYTVAVKSDGTLWSWGRNNFYQLGVGDQTNRLSPVQIGTETDWSLPMPGGYHSLGLKSDGALWGWGDNASGQLSDHSTSTRTTPTRIIAYEATADTTPPAEVTDLAETHTAATVTLTWTNPLDSDFSHVNVYRDDGLIGTNVTTESFADSGLASNTTYTYKVTTVDTSGNESAGVTLNTTTSGGALSITSPSAALDFGTITVDNTIQTINRNLGTLVVEDTTETGEGWHVQLSVSIFTQSGGANLSLSDNILTFNGIDSITQTSGTSPLPSSTGSPPFAVGSSAVTLLSAGVGNGMGIFDVTFVSNPMTLTIDTKEVIVDPENDPTVYSSTLTWTIVSGP